MNRERVQMLRDMIAGIPGERVNLNYFYTGMGEKPCGMIACIAGWAAIYPPFVEQGLHKNIHNRPAYQRHIGMFAAAMFFGVDREAFYPRRTRERGTDKEIALRRLDKLLAK